MIWSVDMARKLYFRFVTIWGAKFTHMHTDTNMVEIWTHDWYEGLAGIDLALFKPCLDYCKINLEWPPSLPQFRKICEKLSGIVDPEEAYELAISNKFPHPFVEKAYKLINDYDFRMGTSENNKRRFIAQYNRILEEDRLEKVKLIGATSGKALTTTLRLTTDL